MKPRSLVILTALLALLAPSLGVSSHAEEKPAQSTIAGWGTVTDPDKDCEYRFTADQLKLSITVPAKAHDLSPVRGLNAPRILRSIRGDFTVQVKVTADFKPGVISTGKGRPFNGAGLLIWENEENFLRIERNAYWLGPEELYCYPPLIEYWRNNEHSGVSSDPTDATYFQGRSTWLKATRQGKNVSVSISHDGKEWDEVKSFQVEMADEVLVGVAAVNTSDAPFTVDFEELTINGKTSSDESAIKATSVEERVAHLENQLKALQKEIARLRKPEPNTPARSGRAIESEAKP